MEIDLVLDANVRSLNLTNLTFLIVTDPRDEFRSQRASLTFIENGRICMSTYEMCPIEQRRKRRTIDYELDDLYDAEHDYNTDDLSDDFIEDHYEQLEEQRMNRTKNRNTHPESSHFIGSMRVLNGETGALPFFVAIRTSTNIHFCGGACKLIFRKINFIKIFSIQRRYSDNSRPLFWRSRN